MGEIYTLGTWTAKEGREDAFIRAWSEMAEWTRANVAGAGSGTLLQDLANPRQFTSFGSWASLEAIEAWRALPGFGERVGRMRDLLKGFEPHTMRAVAP